MTVGKVPNEAELLIAKSIFNPAAATTDRGSSLQLLLFTNTGLTDTSVYADLTEPSTGGYARITLTDASWSFAVDTGTGVTGCIASYATQTFTPSGASWSDIYGAAIVTTGTAPKILAFMIDTTVPVIVADGKGYPVTLSIPVGRLI